MSINVHVKQGPNKWDVSIESTMNIEQVKERIASVSAIPAANQRLIYSGKILKDDQTVESYNIIDGASLHLVKSGGAHTTATASNTANTPTTSTTNTNSSEVPHNINAGQTSGFNPLNDLTGARYAGFLNLPSSDMFGPDGGINNTGPNQDELLQMMENPIFQSQLNEMLSNPQMVDFLIQSNPQLQSMGPQAREMLTNPMFRQMLTNPDVMRQSMQMARMMNTGANGTAESSFPAPGESTMENTTTTSTENTTQTPNPAAATNPFANLFNSNMMNANPEMNSFLQSMMFGGNNNNNNNNTTTTPNTTIPQDTRPPEERYETQLRQLNDMGFFDFDRNVAALRRSGGSVQGAVDALLNGSV